MTSRGAKRRCANGAVEARAALEKLRDESARSGGEASLADQGTAGELASLRSQLEALRAQADIERVKVARLQEEVRIRHCCSGCSLLCRRRGYWMCGRRDGAKENASAVRTRWRIERVIHVDGYAIHLCRWLCPRCCLFPNRINTRGEIVRARIACTGVVASEKIVFQKTGGRRPPQLLRKE